MIRFGVVSILVVLFVSGISGVAAGAPNLFWYLSLDDEISITSSGGEMVNGPGIFVPGVEGSAFGGNGDVYARWDDADVGGLFEGWDDDEGVTVDLYFSGDHWTSHSGDSGLWSIVRRASDRYIILSVQNGKMRHLLRDGDQNAEFKYLITNVTLRNNEVYRLTVCQANGEFDVYLQGGSYKNSVPVFSATDLPAGYTWNFVPGGGNPPRQMNVGRRAIFDGTLQGGEWVDEIRVYNGFYSPAELDTPYARDLYPADNEENVPADAILSWSAPDDRLIKDDDKRVRYNVYFGMEPNELSDEFDFELISPEGGQEDTWISSVGAGEALESLTQYYWRVDVIDPNNGVDPAPIYKGDLLSFVTVPPKATVPYPEDGATNVAQNVVLGWNSGYGADAHDIYLSTDVALVEARDESVRMPRQGAMNNMYECDLEWETEYFWAVDEVFEVPAGEQKALGDVWSFTTGLPRCEYDMPGDVNDDCAVDFTDLAMMAMDWMACNLVNGNCP